MFNKLKKELIYEIVMFVLCIFFIVLLWKQNWLLVFVLAALYLIGNRFWHKKHDYVFFVTGAVLGPIAEIICIQFGVWQYTNPTIVGIPMWLPIAWGIATVMIIRIAETFVRIEKL